MRDWQPIATAPKDGTYILGFEKDVGVHVIQWISCAEFWEDNRSCFVDATHWMPLPEPPTQEENWS